MISTDMTRLCREIVAQRARRSEMLEEMASAARTRRTSVAALCRQFHSARAAMGGKTKKERLGFLEGLRLVVQSQQQATRSDLAGVRRAWIGRA